MRRAVNLAAWFALIAGFVAALAAAPVPRQNLYLLAGTPTNGGPQTFPVDLYSVGKGRGLNLVREIVSQPLGLFAVLDDEGDKIYVAYPHGNPTTVSVIHEGRPGLQDTVTFNPRKLVVDNTAVGVAAGAGMESFAIFPLIRAVAGGGRPRSISLASVSGDASRGNPRVKTNDWSLYRTFRSRGAPGGPIGPGFTSLGEIVGDQVVLQLSPPGRPFVGQPPTSEVALADASPPAPAAEKSGTFYVAVASRRFLAIGSTPGHSSLYVYDRGVHTWRVIRTAGTIQYARRIFGHWLVTIVEQWRPGVSAVNPGRGNERDWGNRALPNVRDEYSFWEGRSSYIPGILKLYNLIDGRRITLDTHEEDSEILDVREDGLVLYRVNDEIFSAHIEGNKLGRAALVVKGEDVPEVHWAFWSNAPATPAPSGRPRTGK